MTGVRAGKAHPFERKPISYDGAFGGSVPIEGSVGHSLAFPANPVGKGFGFKRGARDGKPMPNTEELNRAVDDPETGYIPMSFGPVGRSWQPRVAYCGSYTAEWLAQRAPFFPDDFDDLYFQAAPRDQQLPYVEGGEEVVLKNLTADGEARFRIATDGRSGAALPAPQQ